MVNTSGISKSAASVVVFCALFLFMFLQPVARATCKVVLAGQRWLG
jgi:hypothetical protein